MADGVGFDGEIVYDTGKPDVRPRKLLDTSRINALGWEPRINVRKGVEQTYALFREHHAEPARNGG